MIRLSKEPKPQILVDNQETWTETLLGKIETGQQPSSHERTRYRHPKIKSVLISETSGKCAYCESKLLHIHHGDVEHIYPKSLKPEVTFDWENLTLACEVCNGNKSNKDPFLKHIIDPYETEPSDHLVFTGPLVFSRGTTAGINTRSILDLNRGELSERRKEHLERVMEVIGTVARDDLPTATRRAIFEDLRDRIGHSSSAYSAMTQTVIQQAMTFLPAEVTENSS